MRLGKKERRAGLGVALVSAGALLAGVELLTRLTLPAMARSKIGYDHRALEVLAHEPRRGRTIVWFVGDSTVIGRDVPRDDRPAAVLERVLRDEGFDVDVRPVAHPGIGLENARRMLLHLPLEAGDVALVTTHLGLATQYRDIGLRRLGRTWQRRLEHAAVRLLERSAFVRYSDYLKRIPILLAEELSPHYVGRRLRGIRPGPTRRAEWTRGELRAVDLRSLARRYATIGPDDAAEIGDGVRRIRDFLAPRDVSLVTYISPLNRQIVERYAYANWSRLAAAGAAACASSAAVGVACLDLVGAIPGDFFFDDDHLDASGYRAMIRELAPVIEVTLRRGAR